MLSLGGAAISRNAVRFQASRPAAKLTRLTVRRGFVPPWPRATLVLRMPCSACPQQPCARHFPRTSGAPMFPMFAVTALLFREGAVADGLQKAIETRLAAHRDFLARLSPRQAPLDVMTQLGGCRTARNAERRGRLCEADRSQRGETLSARPACAAGDRTDVTEAKLAVRSI